MGSQVTGTLLMIRPVAFGYNAETATNNSFQSSEGADNQEEINKKATEEFDSFVRRLRDQDIEVIVIDDNLENHTPDSIFPNNWISFHENGTLITYPMYAKNRRTERRKDIIDYFEENFQVSRRYSFEYYEDSETFLEGTGSMVLDRKNKIVYACLSPRTDPIILEKFAVLNNYTKNTFYALDQNGGEIYHTNVMMALGEEFCVVCLESIRDEEERKAFLASMKRTDKEIIDLTYDQMNQFAGNMLQVRNKTGQRFLVMSEQAFRSLSPEQVNQIRKYSQILYSSIDTIEKYGGGSARCMMGEVFLEKKK